MVEASSLKKGEFVVQDGEPYFVEKAQAVVISKHSHTKMKIDLVNLFSGDKRALSVPNHEDFEKADVIRKHGQFISKTGDSRGQVMDMVDFGTLDAEIKEGVKLNEGDEVTYIDFKGRAMILEKRG
jgi:translation elongation factor P/translation initiation factor 5A